MKISISITNYSFAVGGVSLVSHLDAIGTAADGARVDILWVADHLVQADPGAGLDEPMLEACTTLRYLAARTSRPNLGTMVTWTRIRPAALLVKTVSARRLCW